MTEDHVQGWGPRGLAAIAAGLLFGGVAALAAAARAETAASAAPSTLPAPAAPGASAPESAVDRAGAAPPADPRETVVVRGRAGTFSRLPPRSLRSDEERARLAAHLRVVYSQPPGEWPPPLVDEGVPWQEIGLLPEAVHPADNPHSPEKELLGETLFFDPRLSGSGQMACASCHDPDLGWADGRTASFGIDRKPLARNAPSIMNAGYQRRLFWDGRAGSLEEQARLVLLNHDEMRSSSEHLGDRLGAMPRYRQMFAAAFDDERIDLERVVAALACFERTIVGGRSRFDLFLKGTSEAMSDEALLGLHVFRREGRCMNCHHGPLMSDGEFHDVGLSYYGRNKYEDLGRYAVTGVPQDVGRFRTPSLRNFNESGPYMHNGLFPAARGVLNMYNAGMPTLVRKPHQADDPLFPTKSRHLRPLGLNPQDLADLEAFLTAASEPRRRFAPPELPSESDDLISLPSESAP